MRGRILIGALAVGSAVLVAVHLLLLHTYWDYSEGVYALSSRMLLHGADLYGQMVGAQPPGVFLAGMALLAIHDSLEWLRFGVALIQLGGGLVAGEIVWRVTGNRLAALLTPAGILLMPWAIHEHGALTPELIASPVMLGALLLCARERWLALGAILAGLLVIIKLPFAIPAVAIVATSANWRRAAAWAIGTAVVCLGATTLICGSAFWNDVVVAQIHVGTRSLGLLKGVWAQAGWNVLGLLIGSVVAGLARAEARDRPLLTASIALAIANVITFLTNFKVGTGLNVTVPVEASLLPTAVIGTVFAFRIAHRAIRAPAGAVSTLPRPRLVAVVCAGGVVFTLLQSISLIAHPHNPVPFLRAFSAPAWEITLTRPQLDAAVARARTCPPGSTYGGPPLIAMMANRLPPDGQPDGFLPNYSSTLASVGAAIHAARNVCG